MADSDRTIAVAHSARRRPWPWVALAVVLLLAAFLHFFRLEQEGYGNLYYAAAVKSQLGNWHNLFFNSFDPGGFVTVDKPPLGLWVQVTSAAILGFSGLSLLLPQALSGVLSVFLLFHLVRRTFGSTAGLLAALVLAVTPISVAANRNNTMDGLLVLILLLAAWAMLLAVERGRLLWLLLAAFLVGVGFNIKMLQAYMVLPGFYFLYLLAPLRFWKRLLHLTIATVILVVISLSWAIAVDLTPEGERPYIGSTQSNAVMELIIGHNGMARLFPGGLRGLFGDGRLPLPPPGGYPSGPPPSGKPPLPPTSGGGPSPGGTPGKAFSHEIGEPGWLRLFNRQLGGQVSWLLPLAGLGFLAAFWQVPLRRPLDRRHLALFLWAGWLLPQVIFFSIANLFHRYYLEMLSPAIAVLVGAGLVAMWEDFCRSGWRGWLLPAALIATALVEAGILDDFPRWAAWLIPLAVGLPLSFAAILGVLRFLRHAPGQAGSRAFPAWTGPIAALGVLALLIAPTVWALIPVLYGGHAGLPYAGPDLLADSQPGRGQVMQGRQGGNLPPFAVPLADYLLANRRGERFIVATINANTAAPLILMTGDPVMAMGGFSGGDPILDVEELAAYIRGGVVRFFYLTPQGNRQGTLGRWIVAHCREVPRREWFGRNASGPAGVPEDSALFDCQAVR